MKIIVLALLFVACEAAPSDAQTTTYVLKPTSGYMDRTSDSCGELLRRRLREWIHRSPEISVSRDGVGYRTTHEHPPYVADVTDGFLDDAGGDTVYGHFFRGWFRERARRLVIVLRPIDHHGRERIEVSFIGDEPSTVAALAPLCELLGLAECTAVAYGAPACFDRWVDEDAQVIRTGGQ